MKRILNAATTQYIGKDVRVAGWVQRIRAHGKVLFADLRDKSGLLQAVFAPGSNESVYELAKTLRPEWVVEIEGKILERPQKLINPKLETGKVEINPYRLDVHSEAKTIPFSVETDGYEISEEKRLRYRYLDLRRERLKKNLLQRAKITNFIRDFLTKEGFIEIETPILSKSTPEGARDFLVPSRLHPGEFYALPQSPQQYKQLLMVAGFEKYFQIARCFRDEDSRADRQPEFIQLDIEMSFVERDDVLDLIERLYGAVVKDLFPQKKIAQEPFPRISYNEAISKYNTDKPDLRKNKNDKDELAFCFIVDFPMFEWKESEKRWDAVHHPFTKPQEEDINKITANPEGILAHQYDFVLNGFEIAGGSIRTHKPAVLEAVFKVMGHKEEEIKKKFGHLLEAFEYGVPPHGGIASGMDRFVAVLLNEPSIRETIAFPKTGDGTDLMMAAPSEVSEEQLKELRLKTDLKSKIKK